MDMRSKFQIQPQLNIVPIEKIQIPSNSRDQLAPILLALQWIYTTPEISDRIFELLEQKILPGTSKDKGRPGLDLWQILVLGIVRNARDCDYDELEDLASHHTLIRQFLNLPAIAGSDLTNTPDLTHRTISNNVCHITEELLHDINKIVAQHGRTLLSKKNGAEEIIAKCDTYVLETNVHFPTDINLLWDAARKTIDLIVPLAETYNISGWRKYKSMRAALKNQMRVLGNISRKGGTDKQQRHQQQARVYLAQANTLSSKANATLGELNTLALGPVESARLAGLTYFVEMLDKHIDLIERRVLKGETIPHEEKVFSLFEPHTQWISKGKAGCPVELGRKLLITTDQYQLILDYQIMDNPDEHPQAPATVERILAQYGAGSIKSISFDKGFSSKANKAQLQEVAGRVIMPKKGKRNTQEAAEEHQPAYIKLRHAHSTVESNINSLEHHGLDRCPDKGLHGYTRYTGLGVIAYNLHQIGNGILRQAKEAKDKAARRQQRQTQRAAAA
jgi:IS5 family transposase